MKIEKEFDCYNITLGDVVGLKFDYMGDSELPITLTLTEKSFSKLKNL